MKDYLYASGNLFVDLKPETLIGGMLAALVVALATATLYRVVRRRSSEENPTVMAGMILAANVLSMIVAASYVSNKDSLLHAPSPQHSWPGPAVPFQPVMQYRFERDGFPSSLNDPWGMEIPRTGGSPEAWTEWRQPGSFSGEQERTHDNQTSDQDTDRPSNRSIRIPDIVNHS